MSLVGKKYEAYVCMATAAQEAGVSDHVVYKSFNSMASMHPSLHSCGGYVKLRIEIVEEHSRKEEENVGGMREGGSKQKLAKHEAIPSRKSLAGTQRKARKKRSPSKGTKGRKAGQDPTGDGTGKAT